jgi:hypothetical protein
LSASVSRFSEACAKNNYALSLSCPLAF